LLIQIFVGDSIMRTLTIPVYKFSELGDEAKAKARDYFRQDVNLESMVDDFCSIAEIIGLELDTRPVKSMNGQIRGKPEVYYSVGYWQSDYAAFAGTWRYTKGCKKAIRDYAPQDTDLHAIVDQWCDIQRRNFYQLVATCSARRNSQVAETHTVDGRFTRDETLDVATDCVSALAGGLYKRLRDECDYRSSDECIDDLIEINEYEFYENGDLV